MNAKELSKLSTEDLNKKLLELQKEILVARTQIATGSSAKGPGQVKLMKKTIARILTIINHTK